MNYHCTILSIYPNVASFKQVPVQDPTLPEQQCDSAIYSSHYEHLSFPALAEMQRCTLVFQKFFSSTKWDIQKYQKNKCLPLNAAFACYFWSVGPFWYMVYWIWYVIYGIKMAITVYLLMFHMCCSQAVYNIVHLFLVHYVLLSINATSVFHLWLLLLCLLIWLLRFG